MTAKQTVLSASLLALLVAPAAPAFADPGAPPERPDEAPFQEPVPAAPTLGPPGKTGTFSIGAGYSSDEGFIAHARVAQDNLFGTGTRLALDAQLSAKHQRFVVGFEDPTMFGTETTFNANLYNDIRVLPGFTRKAAGGSMTLSHALGPHVRGFIGYRFEQIQVEPGNDLVARSMQEPNSFRGGRLSALRAGIEYNDTNDPFWPSRGTRVGTSIEIADRDLGSEIHMMRTDAWLSHHRALGPFTLHASGTLSTVTDGAPFSERLHFNGNEDLRGYGPGALGPFDPQTGMSLGGSLKYTARGELELPLLKRAGISAVAWADAGGILDQGTRWSGASAGVGLVWKSPIGLVRLDYAVPLDGSKPGFVLGLGGTW